MSNYENLTKAAVVFMQENLARAITVPDVAKAVHYSKVHLELAFRKVTGSGVRDNLIQMRMSRAKTLLMETNLPISEIAYRTGYRDATYFAAAFRLREGATPSQFREASQSARGALTTLKSDPEGCLQPLFQDSFSGIQLGSWWNPRVGRWTVHDGYVEGQSGETNVLLLEKALPENFRIQLECSILGGTNVTPSDLTIALTDETGENLCYEFHVGANENSLGLLRRRGATLQWSSKALIRPGHWHRIVLESKQDHLDLFLDDKEIFSHRDPFPLPYTLRCRFHVAAWRNLIRLRRVAMEDLGFVPMVSAIRQADLLFGEGLYDRAREFYLRYFQSSREASDIAELSYKVGMCCLRQKFLTQAREWFEKVSSFSQGSFWDGCARLALLETLWATGDFLHFKERFLALISNSALQNGLRRIAHDCREMAEAGGFHPAAALAAETLMRMEEPGSFLRALAQQHLANSRILFDQLEDAKHDLIEVIGSPNASTTMRGFARFSLADVLATLGRFDDSEKVLQEIETTEPSPFNLLRIQVQRGRNLWAQGDEKGLVLLQGDSSEPASHEMKAFALLTASLIHCARGDAGGAQAAIEKAFSICPGSYYLSKGMISRFLYPIHLIKAEFSLAADVLKEDAYAGDTPAALRAEQAIRCGILYDLADRERDAKDIWMHTSQRFTEIQCPFWGGLAKRLISGENDLLEQMPFSRAARIEMFFLEGLRCKKRTKAVRARQLFELALSEDHMRLWPSCLAQRSLENFPLR